MPRCVRAALRAAATLFCLLILLILPVAVSSTPSAVARSAPCWQPPVDGTVVDPFRAPTCPYCAGNRGIEFGTAVSTPVRSVAAGRVRFSGPVAGTNWVVVTHADGWLVTYGRLATVTVRRGDAVARGAVVGRTGAQTFFGLRIGGEYRDPSPYLGVFVGRPRLVPLDGSDRRPAPPPVIRCPAEGGGRDRHR